MKKITLLAVAFIAISFASCKKNYVCTCTVSSGTYQGTYTYDLGKIKKSDAKSSCDAAGTQWTTLGGTCDYKTK